MFMCTTVPLCTFPIWLCCNANGSMFAAVSPKKEHVFNQ